MRLKLKYDCQYGFKEMYMTETDLEHEVDVDLMQADYARAVEEDIEDDYFLVDHLEDIYEQFKTRPLDLYEETSKSDDYLLSGIIECLESAILEDAYHKIFKKLTGQFPGYFKMYNCRLVLEDTVDKPILDFGNEHFGTIDDLHNLNKDTEKVKIDLTEETPETVETLKALLENRITPDDIAANKVTRIRELTSNTACAMLGISRQTLANWVKAGRVSRLPNGKYSQEEIKKLCTVVNWNDIAGLLHEQAKDILTSEDLPAEIVEKSQELLTNALPSYIPDNKLEPKTLLEYCWHNLIQTKLVQKLCLHAVHGEEHIVKKMHDLLEKATVEKCKKCKKLIV